MWEGIKERYAELAELDSNCVIDTAMYHKYQYPRMATEDEVQALEARLGVSIPEQLRAIYKEMGNGAFGPDCGMHEINHVEGYRADEEWLGCEYYDMNCPDEQDYEECFSGLANIMGAGYAHECGIVTKGEGVGNIIAYDSQSGFIYIESDSLLDYYNKGLDKLFTIFNQLRDEIQSNDDVELILRVLSEKHMRSPENTLTHIASLINFQFTYDDALASFEQKMEYKLKADVRQFLNSKLADFRSTERAGQRSELHFEN